MRGPIHVAVSSKARMGSTEQQVGGVNASGTVFRINKDGSGFQILTNLSATLGINPVAMLLEGSDGLLYGSCTAGGGFTNGTLWRIQKDGAGFTVLKTLTMDGSEVGARSRR